MGEIGMRVGVIGFGYWGPNHVRVLARIPDLDVVVIESNPAQRDRVSALFPGAPVFGSLAECPDRLDAVVICSPPSTHLAVAAEALSRGCHVMVEKPLALNGTDAAKLVDLASKAQRTLMTGHIYDFHSATYWMEERAAEGFYGDIRYIDAARLAVGGYRTDVNVMWDMAPHDLCLIRRVLGAWPNTVTAWAADHSGGGMADVAQIRLEFADLSTVAYVRVSWLDPVKVRRFTVVGDKRMVIFDDSAEPTKPLSVIETGATAALGEGAPHPVPGAYPEELVASPVITPAEPLANEIEHFLRCVRTATAPERASGRDGLQVVRILEAADRSAAIGEPVAVSAIDEPVGVIQ